MTSGALTEPRMRVTISVMSETSSRPTKAVHKSSMCEPSLTWSRPISTQPSQSSCSCSAQIRPHLAAAAPAALPLKPLEGARAVGVAALADRQVGILLAQAHLGIERGDRGRPGRLARFRHGAWPVSANALQHRVERGGVAGV